MNNFEGHIMGEKPVLVDFFATWCGPCKLMGPVLRQVKDKTGERATVLKLDIDQNPYYTRLYSVHSVPTLMLFRKGRVLWRKSGVVSSQEILEQLKTYLS